VTPAELQRGLALSDDQRRALESYAELLEKWQARINLVAPATLPDLWSRHFLDSAQLMPHLKGLPGPLLDFGSGAGFPGLVLSILGRDDVTMVESDRRKIAFLQEVTRVTGVKPTLEACRIESLRPIRAGIITARALAPVDKLLRYAEPYADETTVFLFLKGEQADAELTTARNTWKMTVTKAPSISDSRGVVLKLEEVSRA
jgi:16S rRNA (guanine527-N7)-methyltransferase